MKILYVYSDYKWTGPSQPIVELCNFMSEKAEVYLLMSTPKRPENKFVAQVRTDRIRLFQGFQKRGGIRSLWKNRRLILRIIRQVKPDVIHFFRERDMITLPGNSGGFIKIFSSFKGSCPGRFKKNLWKTANVVTVFQKKLHDDFMQEIVQDGVNGFVVHDDPKEIMEKIDALYSDRTLFTDFSKRSESQGKSYDLSKIGQAIYALYEQQLKTKLGNFLYHVSISEMDNHE